MSSLGSLSPTRLHPFKVPLSFTSAIGWRLNWSRHQPYPEYSTDSRSYRSLSLSHSTVESHSLPVPPGPRVMARRLIVNTRVPVKITQLM